MTKFIMSHMIFIFVILMMSTVWALEEQSPDQSTKIKLKKSNPSTRSKHKSNNTKESDNPNCVSSSPAFYDNLLKVHKKIGSEWVAVNQNTQNNHNLCEQYGLQQGWQENIIKGLSVDPLVEKVLPKLYEEKRRLHESLESSQKDLLAGTNKRTEKKRKLLKPINTLPEYRKHLIKKIKNDFARYGKINQEIGELESINALARAAVLQQAVLFARPYGTKFFPLGFWTKDLNIKANSLNGGVIPVDQNLSKPGIHLRESQKNLLNELEEITNENSSIIKSERDIEVNCLGEDYILLETPSDYPLSPKREQYLQLIKGKKLKNVKAKNALIKRLSVVPGMLIIKKSEYNTWPIEKQQKFKKIKKVVLDSTNHSTTSPYQELYKDLYHKYALGLDKKLQLFPEELIIPEKIVDCFSQANIIPLDQKFSVNNEITKMTNNALENISNGDADIMEYKLFNIPFEMRENMQEEKAFFPKNGLDEDNVNALLVLGKKNIPIVGDIDLYSILFENNDQPLDDWCETFLLDTIPLDLDTYSELPAVVFMNEKYFFYYKDKNNELNTKEISNEISNEISKNFKYDNKKYFIPKRVCDFLNSFLVSVEANTIKYKYTNN